MLYQNGNGNMPGYGQNTNSKSFIHRSNIVEMPKPANNSSAYLKNSNEAPVETGKFPNKVTSPTNFGQSGKPGFPGGFPTKASNNEMSKSSFHDSKGSDSTTNSALNGSQGAEKPPFMSNTPTRRAPRMSEGGIYEPPSNPGTFPK